MVHSGWAFSMKMKWILKAVLSARSLALLGEDLEGSFGSDLSEYLP